MEDNPVKFKSSMEPLLKVSLLSFVTRVMNDIDIRFKAD